MVNQESIVILYGGVGSEREVSLRSGEAIAQALAANFKVELVRLDTQEFENSFGIVAEDRKEALFSYTLLASSPNTHAGRLHFSGLNPDRFYTVDIIWPLKPSSSSPSILDRINGAVISGDALIHAGLQLPIMQPETLLVFNLQQS